MTEPLTNLLSRRSLAVIGSRAYPNLSEVQRYVDTLPLDTVVVSGGARGVDWTAEVEARQRGMYVVVWDILGNRHKGYWVNRVEANGHGAEIGIPQRHFEKFGPAAYWRNTQIVQEADRVVAFWNGASPGTRHTIDYARARGVHCRVWDE